MTTPRHFPGFSGAANFPDNSQYSQLVDTLVLVKLSLKFSIVGATSPDGAQACNPK